VNALVRHAFRQEQVTAWHDFVVLAHFFGFRVRTTGGCELTHEIDCSAADFYALLQLLSKAAVEARRNAVASDGLLADESKEDRR
jgi:hypothetical protein